MENRMRIPESYITVAMAHERLSRKGAIDWLLGEDIVQEDIINFFTSSLKKSKKEAMELLEDDAEVITAVIRAIVAERLFMASLWQEKGSCLGVPYVTSLRAD